MTKHDYCLADINSPRRLIPCSISVKNKYPTSHFPFSTSRGLLRSGLGKHSQPHERLLVSNRKYSTLPMPCGPRARQDVISTAYRIGKKHITRLVEPTPPLLFTSVDHITSPRTIYFNVELMSCSIVPRPYTVRNRFLYSPNT